ncbi:uncharacterized protein KIAA1614-like [Lytechinus pictus]|uniref:uncharacterized protein KIAA1614-like n=1 Tax=Lytechinus pictus TaxID=7653 RepID=UPI0030B9B4A1
MCDTYLKRNVAIWGTMSYRKRKRAQSLATPRQARPHFDEHELKKSPSLRSLTGLLKKKDKDNETEGVFTKRRSASVLGLATTPDSDRHPRPQRTTEDTDVTSPTHGRKIGRLLDIKPDRTQVIELVKPPNGPFGFYIAKGTSANGNGIFVTRLGDGHPAKILAGLLQVGDEILEINGQDIRRKKLDDVYDLMMDNDSLVLHVRPLKSRSDYGS